MPHAAADAALTIAIATACRSIAAARPSSTGTVCRRTNGTVAQTTHATRDRVAGLSQRRRDRCNGPASMTKPPAMRTTMVARSAVVAMKTIAAATKTTAGDRDEGGLLEDREETRILLLPLRRERPLLAQCLVEFGAEKAVLHPAIDDVPGQHGVVRTVAKHEEVR